MNLRLSLRSLHSVQVFVLVGTVVSILAFASATGVLAQTTELPPLEVESSPKKKVKKKNDVTNTRLMGTGDAPAKAPAAAATGGGTTGGLGEIVGDGGGITGASTTVITREQIERAPQSSLPDIIGREAGVQTKSVFGGVNGGRDDCRSARIRRH